MSCRGFHFCGFCDDCPFDDQCQGKPTSPGYINGQLATKTPLDPLSTMNSDFQGDLWDETFGKVPGG